MLSEIVTREMLVEALINGLKYVLPFFLPVIIAGLGWKIVKIIAKYVAAFYYRLSGYPERQVKKKVKKVADAVDLVSAGTDIMGGVKK